jgi:hypothetical protein
LASRSKGDNAMIFWFFRGCQLVGFYDEFRNTIHARLMEIKVGACLLWAIDVVERFHKEKGKEVSGVFLGIDEVMKFPDKKALDLVHAVGGLLDAIPTYFGVITTLDQIVGFDETGTGRTIEWIPLPYLRSWWKLLDLSSFAECDKEKALQLGVLCGGHPRFIECLADVIFEVECVYCVDSFCVCKCRMKRFCCLLTMCGYLKKCALDIFFSFFFLTVDVFACSCLEF